MTNTSSLFETLKQLGSGPRFLATVADMLERVDMFRDLSRQEVEAFATYVQAYSAPKGCKLLIEGSKERYMFFVTDGKVDIYKNGADYRSEKKLATVRPGKSIGEMSLIDGLPHSATAIVSEPATLLLITYHNYDKLTQTQPELALKLIQKIALLMSLRLRQTSGILVDHLSA